MATVQQRFVSIYCDDVARRHIHSVGKHKKNLLRWIFVGCILYSIVVILFYEGWVIRQKESDNILYGTIHPTHHEQILPQQEKNSATKMSTETTKAYTKCPKEYCNLVWFKYGPEHKLYEPVYRAFHSRGYSRTEDITRAHFLWSDQPKVSRDFYKGLKPWQRYNHFPNTNQWDDKDKMADIMNKFYLESGIQPLHSFPESYLLHHPDGLEAFRTRLLNGGVNVPWVLKEPTVNQGKGIAVLPPQSKELKGIIKIIEDEIKPSKGTNGWRLVVQNYICDEMTYGGRKFDVRVFWAVVSVVPLVVVFHTEQNYVRIGHRLYDESKLEKSTTRDILTTHTFGATETKATWDEFREHIENHVFGSESKFRYRFSEENILQGHNSSTMRDSLETIEAILSDPFLHVQNQMKTVIGHLANAYQNITFHGRDVGAENGFSWHAADMIIDNNLDVYIIEGTDGPGKDEDYDFRIKMHGELLGSLVDIVEEVTSSQAKGLPLDVWSMKEKGVLGGYEVVYYDGWFMDYRYQRLPKQTCRRDSIGNVKAKDMHSNTISTRKIVPASFLALPKKHRKNDGDMTFWMKSRTSRRYEPVARSLRRNGWTPVNVPEHADLIYHLDEYNGASYPWQWLSQFPSQFSFFNADHLQYLDHKSGNVCWPVRHGDRRIEIIVYWLVLSLDPLTVLYHDGFVYFEYTRDDENEFLDIAKGDGKIEKIWDGSWQALEHYVNITYANVVSSENSKEATAIAANAPDPISHVRNQMKASIVKMAKGFSRHAMAQNGEYDKFSSFALFYAQFQVDQNLNVFATDAQHSYVRGEDHAEIVALHDELYGSAFRLLRNLNSTLKEVPVGEQKLVDTILGKYEWLIKPDVSNSRSEPWTFRYEWIYKANECIEK